MAAVHKTQLKLNFYKKTTSTGQTVTRVRFRREAFTPNKDRGVLHKVVGLRDRVTGDVPSVTKTLNSIQPKTVGGKAGLYVTKRAYSFSKSTVRTALNAGLFVEDVLSPDKQMQLHFTKTQTSDGKYKTKVKVVNSTDFSHEKDRGLLHKVQRIQSRVRGDVPSVTNALNSINPKTNQGRAGLFVAKSAYKFSKGTAKTLFGAGLFVEDVLSPDKQMQLHFTRTQTSNGKYKTKVRIVNSKDFNREKDYGIFNNVYKLKYRVRGDVPSVTKALKSISPDTTIGKAGLTTVKGAYKFSKGTLRTVLKVGCVAENLLSPNKQLQLHFTREQTADGKFKTKARFVNSRDFSAEKRRGIVHKTVALKERVKGDVPSLTKTLKKFKPTTYKGIIGVSVAKGSYNFVKASVKTAETTALVAEDAALLAQDKAVQKFKKKVNEEADDDMSRSLLKTAHIVRKSVGSSARHISERRVYKHEKQRLQFRKNDVKVIGRKNKEFRREQKEIYLPVKQKFKAIKKSYKQSDKTPLRKALYKHHKKDFKAAKKEYKQVKRNVKKANKVLKKRKNNQRKIKFLKKPHSVPVKLAISVASYGWNKLASKVDPDNDVGKVITTTVNGAISVYQHDKKTIIKRAEKRDRKLEKKSNKQQGKLKKREYNRNKTKKPKRKSSTMWKRWQRAVGYNPHKSLLENASEMVKNILVRLAKAVGDFMKYVLSVSVPVLAFIICFMIVVMMVASILSESSFVLGTYTAKDDQLSKAVEEYTKIAADFNDNLLDCKDKNNWKDALSNLGVTGKYENNPSEFIYGRSYQFPYSSANYDFDPYILWSFLCAYYYDFEASYKAERGGNSYEPEYWTLDSDGKNKIEELFYSEYVFHHYYDDRSHWSELDSYEFLPNNDNSSFWSVYDNNNFGHGQMEMRNVGDEIGRFAKDNIIYFSERTLEVLNANKLDKNGNMTRTGWYIQDQTSDVWDNNGNLRRAFYDAYIDGQYYFFDGSEPRSSFYWTSNNQEIYYVVNPTDTNYATGGSVSDGSLVSFYRKNQWLESGTLYYTVEQKQSFLETARSLLRSMSYAKDRLEYFELLVGEDTQAGRLYGNHQTILSPVQNKSMQDLISENRIYNGFGYDVQNWNEEHCSIGNDMHMGIDIACATTDTILSPIDGEITAIDDNSIEITSDKIDFWYEDSKHKVRITIDNIRCLNNISVGDEVKAGDILGNPTANHKCGSLNNINVNQIYIHTVAEIRYIGGWEYIDPRIIVE